VLPVLRAGAVEPELAGVLEDRRAVADDVLVELNARTVTFLKHLAYDSVSDLRIVETDRYQASSS
jgi:hypothetical protein